MHPPRVRLDFQPQSKFLPLAGAEHRGCEHRRERSGWRRNRPASDSGSRCGAYSHGVGLIVGLSGDGDGVALTMILLYFRELSSPLVGSISLVQVLSAQRYNDRKECNGSADSTKPSRCDGMRATEGCSQGDHV